MSVVRRFRDFSRLDRVLENANGTPELVRDRALMLLICATRAKLRAICALRIDDFDFMHHTVAVRDRLAEAPLTIAMPDSAMAWIEDYMYTDRPRLMGDAKHDLAFVHGDGLPVSPGWVKEMLRASMNAVRLDRQCLT
jgi:site-specific recombinase XerD